MRVSLLLCTASDVLEAKYADAANYVDLKSNTYCSVALFSTRGHGGKVLRCGETCRFCYKRWGAGALRHRWNKVLLLIIPLHTLHIPYLCSRWCVSTYHLRQRRTRIVIFGHSTCPPLLPFFVLDDSFACAFSVKSEV